MAETYTVAAVSYSFTMAFDTGGRVLSQGYPDTDSVGPLTCDAAGRLKTVPGLVTNVLCDVRGHQTNVTRPNGASTTLTRVGPARRARRPAQGRGHSIWTSSQKPIQ